ncbi:hypothetical protein ACN47E_000491 [Coniothyrium glycines]
MFRRIEDSLEADPSFPADLKQLGFFVNNVGQICMIDAPDKHFMFNATNNERVNEVRREAFQTCERDEVEKRLRGLGLERLYLPGFSIAKPEGPHIPILAPSPQILKKRKRIVVLVNDTLQDLGIITYGQLQRELGINGGSVVNFAKELIKQSAINNTVVENETIFRDGYELEDRSETPALVVLNTGQLLYSHKYNRAMTPRSWSAMPRKSITHDMIRIHEEENRVPGHRTANEHVKSVFDDVLCNPDRVAAGAEVYVVAIEGGTDNMLNLLVEDFDRYGSRITAMALVESLVDDAQITDPKLKAFLHQRTRQWKHSDLTFNPLHCISLPEGYNGDIKQHSPQTSPTVTDSAAHISWHENIRTPAALPDIPQALQTLALDSPQPSPPTQDESTSQNTWPTSPSPPCPTFAASPLAVAEYTFTDPSVQSAILSFFSAVSRSPSTYRNPEFTIFTTAPRPSPSNPLAFSADTPHTPDPAPQYTDTQLALQDAGAALCTMKAALAACPTDIEAVQPGRDKLVRRIEKQERSVAVLEGQVTEQEQLGGGEWTQKGKGMQWEEGGTGGAKMAIAGAMVDSELVRAAGLLGEDDGEGDEDEKAFI